MAEKVKKEKEEEHKKTVNKHTIERGIDYTKEEEEKLRRRAATHKSQLKAVKFAVVGVVVLQPL